MVDENFKPLNDRSQKSSEDILKILMNIKQMFISYRCCVNKSAACSMLMALGIEAQTLALKLRAIHVRWQTYIPFHEALDIDFAGWAEEIEICISTMKDDVPRDLEREEYEQFKPSEEYLFDLYSMTWGKGNPGASSLLSISDETSQPAIDQDTQLYVKHVRNLICGIHVLDDHFWLDEACDMASSELRDSILNEYERLSAEQESMYEEAQKSILACFNSLNSQYAYSRCCIKALTELKKALQNLADYFKQRFTKEMFTRFSLRIYYHLSEKHFEKANNQVSIWQNSWPEEEQQKCAQEEKNNIIETLQSRHYGKELAHYVNMDAPNVIGSPSFGRFLNKNREKLTRDDVREIHYYCRIIYLLNQIIDNEGAKGSTEVMRHLTAEHEAVLKKINAMKVADFKSWQNITPDNFLKAIRRALGMGEPLSTEKQREQSALLWKLFINRDGCNNNGINISFMATWLNIIGLVANRGYIDENLGAPRMAQHFFPQCEKKDFNFVYKPRKGKYSTDFKKVVPLLEYCLKG